MLAVNVNDSVSWEITCLYAEREKVKSIGVMEIRNMGQGERGGGETSTRNSGAGCEGTTDLTLVNEEEVDEEKDVEEEYEDEV